MTGNSALKRLRPWHPAPSPHEMGGRNAEAVAGLIFLGSETTADADCSPEIKRCLLLGRKAVTNLDSVLESRDNTLPTKVCIVKAVFFSVVTCRCESWTIKKAKC